MNDTVLSQKILKCKERLENKYSTELNSKVTSFISLGIQNQYELTIREESSRKNFGIEELVDQMEDLGVNRVALLGGPGAGKSTLLLKLAIIMSSSETGKSIPVLVRCGLEKNVDVKKLVHLSGFSDKEKESLWEEGRLCIIFDGINEVSDMSIKEFLNNISMLSEDYPECKFIISCRSLEYPEMEFSPFEKYSVLPVTDKQIEDNLKNEFGEKEGSSFFEELRHSTRNYLLDICRTPLLLSLLINIISNAESKDKSITTLKNLKNRNDIYKQFYKTITARQQSKNTTSEHDMYYGLRDELFKTLSYYMQANNLVYIEEESLVNFIRNIKYRESRSVDVIRDLQKKENGNEWYWSVLEELVKSGFLNMYEKNSIKTHAFSFIHQSFQEYFAGCFLSGSKRIDDFQYTSYLLQAGTINRTVLSGMIRTKRNWDTLEFATNQDSKNKIISYMMKYAQRHEDPDALVLAANCIKESETARADISLVEDCCIWLLEAFKYWDMPYKYNLIYAANNLLKYVGPDFPQRLISDIRYFGNKYTGGFIAIEYPETFDFEYLQDIIKNGVLEYKLNAIFTLGERVWLKEHVMHVLDYLFSLINDNEILIREQAIKAVKSLLEHNPTVCLDEAKMQVLISIINNKNESARIRTYTLNTVAITGNNTAIPVFMSYLKDKSNPYRDSASWSLQELIIKSKKEERYSQKEMQQFYFECLINESDDEDGMYSKGNLAYTLSKLEAIAYIPQLKEWIMKETEPYVQEDGINAIGVLGGKNEIEFIKQYVNSDDPVIRSKALKSMIEILQEDVSPDFAEMIKKDKYSIVSFIADKEEYIVNKTIDELLEINEDNNKVPDITQNYKYVDKVYNNGGGLNNGI